MTKFIISTFLAISKKKKNAQCNKHTADEGEHHKLTCRLERKIRRKFASFFLVCWRLCSSLSLQLLVINQLGRSINIIIKIHKGKRIAKKKNQKGKYIENVCICVWNLEEFSCDGLPACLPVCARPMTTDGHNANACVRANVFIHMYICMYMHTYVRICMYIYMEMCVLGTKRCGALGFNVCKISIEISVFSCIKPT